MQKSLSRFVSRALVILSDMEKNESTTGWKIVLMVIVMMIIFLLLIMTFFYYAFYQMKNFGVFSLIKDGNTYGSATQNIDSPPSTEFSQPTSVSMTTPSLVPTPKQISKETLASIPSSPTLSPVISPKQSTTPLFIPPATPVTTPTVLPLIDSFETGLVSWQSTGDVTFIQQKINPSSLSSPHHGQNMIRIGREKNEGNSLSQNNLYKQLPIGTKKVRFWYSVFSYDYQGFDDPAFIVQIDGKIVLQKTAAEVDKDHSQTKIEKLDSTGWRESVLEVQPVQREGVYLVFQAGNDELNLSETQQHQSWVYLDSILFE